MAKWRSGEVVIVDYGMGNLRSVAKALEAIGVRPRLTASPRAVDRAAQLIVPGVGAFPKAMQELRRRRLVAPLKRYLASGRPYLGICLGLQLLFESSEEEGGADGLGVLAGTVPRFPDRRGLKVPHMGWNQVRLGQGAGDGGRGRCPLLRGIPNNSFFYFVHSYYAKPRTSVVVAGTTQYGVVFASLIWKGNVFATQFHPEKSQQVGLRLLKNFVTLPPPRAPRPVSP